MGLLRKSTGVIHRDKVRNCEVC